MKQKQFKTKFGDKEIIIETGKYAQAANGSCIVRCGETVLLATAVMSKQVRQGLGFFPLMVDYEEKLYAAGRIKGSRFIKREGRPTDEAVLVGRFIDRAIRPLFDERIKNDVQVIITALSFDGEIDPDILGLIGASCALHMSDIPWQGPIGGTRISKIDDTWLVNATYEERAKAEFDLDVAGTTEKVVMIEARANQSNEKDLLEAFERGCKSLKPVIKLIEEVRAAVGKEKDTTVIEPQTEEAKALVSRRAEVKKMAEEFLAPAFEKLCYAKPTTSKSAITAAKNELKRQLTEHMAGDEYDDDDISYACGLIYGFTQDEASRHILKSDKRIDGRALDEVRPLTIDAGVLPRVHGSGHFSRGTTQVLGITTLGSPGDKQTLDGMEHVGDKRYIHHYNFTPYSVGEAKPLRGASRRDIGHGALAEKALEPVLPDKESFPYTIRVVSEVLSSNGSSSMASACASTLSLMDAGVPIKAPVAGIAMGLASDGKSWKVLTDLQDIEDGKGGMDFKVTGTREGFTAIQMDTKTDGLTHDIIEQALIGGRKALSSILDQIEKVIPAPREELSELAPRIISLMIDPDKIRDVIGPGGKMINEIIEKTGVETIDIEQDGSVFITAIGKGPADAAYEWVHNLTREVEAGETFTGEVVRLMDFGAFVNILPGKDGMVHISELAPWRVAKVEDIVKLGDKVNVVVKEIDDMGRVNLSMKQAEGNKYTEEMKAKADTSPPRSGGGRPPARGGRGGGGRPPRGRRP